MNDSITFDALLEIFHTKTDTFKGKDGEVSYAINTCLIPLLGDVVLQVTSKYPLGNKGAKVKATLTISANSKKLKCSARVSESVNDKKVGA